MTGPTDLQQASREELLAVVAAQQALIEQLQATGESLQARVRELEKGLGAGGGRGAPPARSVGDPSAAGAGDRACLPGAAMSAVSPPAPAARGLSRAGGG